MSTPNNPKFDKILEARMKLKARFEEKMKQTPAMADEKPMGTGPKNRHGMPQLPIGQHETKQWPVLDLGIVPSVTQATWTLTIDGLVNKPLTLSWKDFLALEQTEDVSDFHCVTTWSRMDMDWKGVRFADLAALVEPKDEATHVLCHAYDGYTTNVSLVEAMKPDVLLVHTALGEPLPKEHGGPVRMITPQLYAWKGAKWISRIQFLSEDHPGFWEVRGYSNSAHPWRNDRYG
jgi:DMSO/TMAO reductase YedYZ molybdopterin-dependent catalytic subunit